MAAISDLRIRTLSNCPLRDGAFVLYWMTAFRRPTFNHALEYAIQLAMKTKRPLLVMEGLRAGYRWASPRFHRFVVDGMRDNAKAFAAQGVTYVPYVEPEAGAGQGLLEALAQKAVMVVGDDFPAFFLPRMVSAAGRRFAAAGIRFEVVDSNGLYPTRATNRVFTTAASFRRHLQKELPPELLTLPDPAPLGDYDVGRAAVDPSISLRWPQASTALLRGDASINAAVTLASCTAPGPISGGFFAAQNRLAEFLDTGLEQYGAGRSHPDDDTASGLSPYIHFGHISTFEIFSRIAHREGWAPDRIAAKATGGKEGWWRMSGGAEAFVDELVTWREIGFNKCTLEPDTYDQLDNLPGWARATLENHREDERPQTYDLETLTDANTHDPIWNAAQRQLVRDGSIHNYLRMLWGKKIFEWSATPELALERMIELNNRYALDGRDPNSYSGIFWVLGRYDRAWGPERPIYGKLRYMTSESTRRKLRLANYLQRYSAQGSSQ